MELTLTTILVAFAGVFLICFMKGAFGGGFSIVGIPLLSFVMDPVTAGGLLAPLFIAMDLFALRYWKPSTWSKPDLVRLLPGLVFGIAFGYLLFRFLDQSPGDFALDTGQADVQASAEKVAIVSKVQVHFGVDGQVRRQSDLPPVGRKPNRTFETG